MFRCCTFLAAGLFSCGLLVAQDSFDIPAFWLSHAATDAAAITDPSERAGVYTAIASDYLADGDHQAAMDMAAQASAAAPLITDPLARFRAEMALVALNQSLDNASGIQLWVNVAEQAAAQIQDPGAQQFAKQQIATEQVVSGGFMGAMDQLNSMSDPADRARAAVAYATTFAQAGPSKHFDYTALIQRAKFEANRVSDLQQRDGLIASIAQTQARSGDQAARTTAIRIVDPSSRGAALTAIAEAALEAGNTADALSTVSQITDAAKAASPDRRAAIWLDIARLHHEAGDNASAAADVQSAEGEMASLEPADRADAMSAASRLLADAGDSAGAAALAKRAVEFTDQVVDPQDALEVSMELAAAQARCGLGGDARKSLAAAEAAAKNIPAAERHPDGDPPPQAYLEVIQAAANGGDFATAQAIADGLTEPRVRHDAVLIIAAGEVNASQFQAAEDAVHKEGSADAEASVCGIIAGTIARTRNPADAEKWVERLSNPSDKAAARLAVAQVVHGKG